MKTTLLSFCESAARELDSLFSCDPHAAIRRFMELRYDVVHEHFRFDHIKPSLNLVFSVAQATPDFFERSLRLITGEEPMPTEDSLGRPLSEYDVNYLRWIEAGRREIASV